MAEHTGPMVLNKAQVVAHAVGSPAELRDVAAHGLTWAEVDVVWDQERRNWVVIGHPRRLRAAGGVENTYAVHAGSDGSGMWSNIPLEAPSLMRMVTEATRLGVRLLVELKPHIADLYNLEKVELLFQICGGTQHLVVSFDHQLLYTLWREFLDSEYSVSIGAYVNSCTNGTLNELTREMGCVLGWDTYRWSPVQAAAHMRGDPEGLHFFFTPNESWEFRRVCDSLEGVDPASIRYITDKWRLRDGVVQY